MVIEATEEFVWQLLENVKDPEVPVLSVVDLGIIREVKKFDGGWQIVITPTYSGCPAMHMIEEEIKSTLIHELRAPIEVITVLSPAWTTDWMSEAGKVKLAAYGIAPPAEPSADKRALMGEKSILKCPQCGSINTVMISQFGSTACKSLFRCEDCLEPFDYFKCLW